MPVRSRLPPRPLLYAAIVVATSACGSSRAPIVSADLQPVTTDAGPSVEPKALGPTTTEAAMVVDVPPPAASPLLMPSGRPACGNITMRAPTPPDCVK